MLRGPKIEVLTEVAVLLFDPEARLKIAVHSLLGSKIRSLASRRNRPLFTGLVTKLARIEMSKTEVPAECERMADNTRNPTDKANWLSLA